MMLVPYPLYPLIKQLQHLNRYRNRSGQMSDSILLKKKHHLKDSFWQERIQARQWIQVQNVSMSVSGFSCSETVCRQINDTSHKRTFLLYSLIPQMASVKKQPTEDFLNKKHFWYTECPAIVCDKIKPLYTAEHTT